MSDDEYGCDRCGGDPSFMEPAGLTGGNWEARANEYWRRWHHSASKAADQQMEKERERREAGRLAVLLDEFDRYGSTDPQYVDSPFMHRVREALADHGIWPPTSRADESAETASVRPHPIQALVAAYEASKSPQMRAAMLAAVGVLAHGVDGVVPATFPDYEAPTLRAE